MRRASAASSAKAADLLNREGSGLVSFASFAASSASAAAEDVDAALDAELVLVLRKLSKRDVTTKIKALDELAEMVQAKPVDDVAAALGKWSKAYAKLALDNDRRVRDGAQRVLAAVVARVQRRIAPHLKTLMPWWLAMRFDQSRDVARSAAAAFEQAFPTAPKERAALFHCADDVLATLTDLVVVQTPDTIGDNKVLTKDELAAVYERSVSAALQALAHFATVTAEPAQAPESPDRGAALPPLAPSAWQQLLEAKKLWTQAKHASPTVRRAFYRLLSALALRAPDALAPHLETVHGVLFSFAERDGHALASLWEAVTVVSSALPAIWTAKDPRKALLPAFMQFLRNGCFGSGRTSYPSLLVVTAAFPTDIVGISTAALWEPLLTALCDGAAAESFGSAAEHGKGFADTLAELWTLLLSSRSGLPTYEHGSVQYLAEMGRNSAAVPLAERVDLAQRIALWTVTALLAETTRVQTDRLASALAMMLTHASSRPELAGIVKAVAEAVEAQSIAVVSDEQASSGAVARVDAMLAVLREGALASVVGVPLTVRVIATVVSVIVHRPEVPVTVRLGKMQCALGDAAVARACPWDAVKALFGRDVCAAGIARWDLIATSVYADALAAVLRTVSVSADEAQRAVDGVLAVVMDAAAPLHAKTVVLQGMQSVDGAKLGLVWPSLDAVLDLVFHSQSEEVSAVGEFAALCLGAPAGALGVSEAAKLVTMRELLAGVEALDELAIDTVERLMHRATHELLAPSHDIASAALFRLATASDTDKPGAAAVHELQTVWGALASSVADLPEAVWQPWLASLAQRVVSHPSSVVARLRVVDLAVKGLQSACGAQLLRRLVTGLADTVVAAPDNDTLLVQFRDFAFLPGVLFPAYAAGPAADQSLLASTVVVGPIEDPAVPLHTLLALGVLARHGGAVLSSADAVEACATVVQALVLHLARSDSRLDRTLEHAVLGMDEHTDAAAHLWKALLAGLQPAVAVEVLAGALRGAEAATDASGSARLVHELVRRSLRTLHAAKTTAFAPGAVPAQLVLHSTVSAICGVAARLDALAPVLSDVPFEARIAAVAAWVPHLSLADGERAKRVTAEAIAVLRQLPPEQAFGAQGVGRIEAWKRLALLHASMSIVPEPVVALDAHMALYATNTGEHLRGRERAVQAEAAGILAKLLAYLPMPVWAGEGAPSLRTRWDFVMARLTSWLSDAPLSAETLLLWHAAFRVLQEIAVMFREEAELVGTAPLPLSVASLLRDWNSCRAALFGPVMQVYFANAQLSRMPAGRRLLRVAARLLPECTEALVVPDQQRIVETLQTYLRCLRGDFDAVQRGAYSLIQRAMQIQAQTLSLAEENTPDAPVEAEQPASPEHWKHALGDVLALVLQTVLDVRRLDMQESLRTDGTERDTAHHYLLAYLLGWLLVLDHLDAENTRLRLQHVAFLQRMDGRPLDELMLVLAELLNLHDVPFAPRQPLHRVPLGGWDASDVDLSRAFAQLAAHVLWRFLRGMPAFVRDWWSDCTDRKLKQTLEKYVETHFTSSIVATHVAAVTQGNGKASDNMVIKASTAGKQVTAVYKIEEMSMEMAIRFPPSFPLRPATVESGTRVGVSESQWRRWLLSMTTVIASQNGTILEALQMWKQDADKMFEGIEECAICYCVISTLDRSLPKVACKTCKHKFHAVCLYKWFKSSSQSTCPLCRNLF